MHVVGARLLVPTPRTELLIKAPSLAGLVLRFESCRAHHPLAIDSLVSHDISSRVPRELDRFQQYKWVRPTSSLAACTEEQS